MGKYLLNMFILCFFVWGVVIDNLILPSENELKQDVGVYTRYRVKTLDKDDKLDILENQLMVYAVVDNREQVYYMEHKSYFENRLKMLPEGTPVQMRYVRRFPKFWKRHMYDMREAGIPIIRYSAIQLHEKQTKIWTFTGIMGGVFLALALVGWIGRPRRR